MGTLRRLTLLFASFLFALLLVGCGEFELGVWNPSDTDDDEDNGGGVVSVCVDQNTIGGIMATPWGLALDGDFLYATDNSTFELYKINLTRLGELDVVVWVTNGSDAPSTPLGAETLTRPEDVVVDSSGDVFVADRDNGRVLVFRSSDGAWLRTIPRVDDQEQLSAPSGLAFGTDNLSELFVTDGETNRIAVFDKTTGAYLREIGAGTFANPGDITRAFDGNLYVADRTNGQVRIYTQDGEFVSLFGNQVPGADEEMQDPWGIEIAAGGRVYVTDRGLSRISQWSSANSPHTHVANLSDPSDGEGPLQIPNGLILVETCLYVGDGERGWIRNIPTDDFLPGP